MDKHILRKIEHKSSADSKRKTLRNATLQKVGIFMSVHISFSSVWVADLPPFGKELLNPLTISYLCILTICNFSHFVFWF